MESGDLKKIVNDLERSLKKIKIDEKNLKKISKNLSKQANLYYKPSSIKDFKVDKNTYNFPGSVVTYKVSKDDDFSGFFGGSDEERISWKKQKKLDNDKFMDKKTQREYRLLAYMSGIPPETPVSDIKRVLIEKKSGGRTYFVFESKRYHIAREYDFSSKTLINKFITTIDKSGEKERGAGLNIIVRQIANLKEFGKIKKIEGEFLKADNLFGYYVFLRYGFIPDKVAQTTYREVIEEYNKLYPNDRVNKIEDFLKTQTGRNFWKEKGGDWDGYFDLSDDSYSMKTLGDYVKNKIDKDLFNITFK